MDGEGEIRIQKQKHFSITLSNDFALLRHKQVTHSRRSNRINVNQNEFIIFGFLLDRPVLVDELTDYLADQILEHFNAEADDDSDVSF